MDETEKLVVPVGGLLVGQWFAGTVVGVGTLVLFAALGTLGQLIALLVFVYLALASSGGTVPLDALAGFFRFLAEFEPLRQIVGGTRAILYFDGSGAAGLTRAFVSTAIGLAFWVELGAAITSWYDPGDTSASPQPSWSTSIMPFADTARKPLRRTLECVISPPTRRDRPTQTHRIRRQRRTSALGSGRSLRTPRTRERISDQAGRLPPGSESDVVFTPVRGVAGGLVGFAAELDAVRRCGEGVRLTV